MHAPGVQQMPGDKNWSIDIKQNGAYRRRPACSLDRSRENTGWRGGGRLAKTRLHFNVLLILPRTYT